MPQVPYNPVPTQSPRMIATPMLSQNVDANAFGANVGQALSHLGDTVGHASNEIFTRALALQNLRNEADARQADTDYMMEASKLHADFNSLEGKNAVDAYPKYMEDLRNARERIRGGLQTATAQKLYDAQSMPFMGRTIFNGAGHAAAQNKRYVAGTSQARVNALKDDALSQPKDDAGFQRSLERLPQEIDFQGDIAGWGDEQKQNQKSAEISQLWSNRVVGLSRTDPWKAKEMLEANRQYIRGQDLLKVDQIVNRQLETTGSRNISDAVNAGWAPYMKQGDVDKAVGIEETLTRVVKQAQRDNPDLRFSIGKGKVTEGEAGRTVFLTPIDEKGNAVPNDKEGFGNVQEAMRKAAEKLGIPIEAVGEWNSGRFQLPKDYDVRKAPKAVEEPLQSRVDRAADYARKYAPELTTFGDVTRERVISDFNRGKSIKRDRDLTNKNIVDEALVNGATGGNVPTTVEELTSDARVKAAWEDLDPSAQLAYLKKLATNARGETAWTAESIKRYQQLKGQAYTDPKGFLDLDVTSEKFPNRAKLELVNLQNKLKQNAEADPRVRHALDMLGPDLQAAGITVQNNRLAHDQFVGALQDQLERFQRENTRPPRFEEIRTIGAQLMQTNGGLWGWFGTRTFEYVPSDDEAAKIKALPGWAEKGIVPTDEMVQRFYAAKKFQELYGKKKEESTPNVRGPR